MSCADGYDGYSDEEYDAAVCPLFTQDGEPCTRPIYHGGFCH